jgi:hypothetical protein
MNLDLILTLLLTLCKHICVTSRGDSQGNVPSVIAWVSEGLVPAIQWHSGGHSSGPTGKWQPTFPRIYLHAIVT